jgi:methylenetetrahydrofolate dehydrogenase (NADP+)/methenyltetrahydrofolate cyclohydrolase
VIELRGAPVARAIRDETAAAIAKLEWVPHLASVLDPAAEDAAAYSRQLGKACERAGLRFSEHAIDADAGVLIRRLNDDDDVTAVFLHEPASVDLRALVNPAKDPERPVPCTAQAVVELLRHYHIGLDGADVVIVGRSATVGRPLANLLLDMRPGPTVTICHTGTKSLRAHTMRAEVVVAAAGRPRLVDAVADGAVVVDVGTNVVDGQLAGDVDAAAVSRTCGALSPVPGGVGPVTVACLLRSVVRMARLAAE